MATTLAAHPAAPPAEHSCPGPAPAPFGPPMTRCECAGLPFEDVARRMAAEGLPAEQAVRRTGCGQNCEACLPDLLRYLASAAVAEPAGRR